MVGTHRRVIAACALLIACGGTKVGVSTQCTTNSECPAGELCDPKGDCICGSDAGCGLDGGEQGVDAHVAATLLTIGVGPANPTVALGATLQLTATGTYSDGSTQDLTSTAMWSSSLSAIASVSSSGLVQSVTSGMATVSAAVGAISGSTDVTVGPAEFVSLAVSPNGQHVPVGGKLQLKATGTYSDGSTQDLTSAVTWASSDISKANVSPAGIVTGEGQGLATITATDGNVSANAAVTINPPALSGITVTPSDPMVVLGSSLQLTATAVYTDGSMTNITTMGAMWSIDMPTVASIAQTGVLTTLSPGTATVTVAYMGLTGSTSISVMAATLVSIAVTPANPSIPVGATVALTATGKYSDSSVQDLTQMVTWSTLQPTIASVDTMGNLLAVAAGSTSVVATLGMVKGSTNVKVGPAALSMLTITPANGMISLGTTVQLTATGTYTDGSMHNVTSSTAWVSSSPQTASVSASGSLKALAIGSVTITATDSGVMGSTQFTVTMASLQSMAITPAGATVPVGGSQQMTATGTFSDGTHGNVTAMCSWMSGDSTVATVSSAGVVTAVSQGTVTMTATDGSVMAQTMLSVGPAAIASIAITPARQSIALGNTIQLTATGTWSDGTMKDVTMTASWAASTNGVLQLVSSTGNFQGAEIGMGIASATVGTVVGSTEVTVTQAVLESLAINPSTASVPVGQTIAMVAEGTESDMTQRDLTSGSTWTSSNTAVATVSAPGSIFAQGPGTATITATNGGFMATATVTVLALTSISVTPNGATVAAGLTQQLDAMGTYGTGPNSTMLDITNSATWSSSNNNVATVAPGGLVTGVAMGSVTIFATEGSISGSVSLTVGQAGLVSIAVGPTSFGTPLQCSSGVSTIDFPETEQFSAEGTYTDGSTADVSSQVSWTASDPTVAFVSGSGLMSSVGPGSVTVSATLNGVTGSYDMSVLGPTSISVAGPSGNVPSGTTATFVATGTFADGTMQFVTLGCTWTSSNTMVATISTPGNVLAVGKNGQEAKITASIGAVSGQTPINVSSGTLVSIDVEPANQMLQEGGLLQLRATGTYSDGTMNDLTNTALWSSSNSNVASVDALTGLVQAGTTDPGTPQIVATSGSVQGMTTVTVP